MIFPTATHPIEDVQSSIRAKGKEIMRGDAFRFSSFRNHKQLW